MTQQVKKDAMAGRTEPLRRIRRYSGLKIPVTTAPKMIMDRNGHRSQPSRIMDIRKKARKNNKII
jgi:hypothetical protein